MTKFDQVNLRSGIGYNLISSLVSGSVQYLVILLISRYWDGLNLGLYMQIVLAVSVLGIFGDFGFGNYLLKKRLGVINEYWKYLSYITVLTSVLFAIVYFNFDIICNYLDLRDLRGNLLIVYIIVLLSSIISFQANFINVIGYFKVLAIAEIVSAVLNLVILLGGFYYDVNVWIYFVLTLVVLILKSIYFISKSVIYFSSNVSAGFEKIEYTSQEFKFSLFLSLERGFNFLAGSIDKLIISKYFDLVSFGRYSALNQIVTRPYLVLSNAISKGIMRGFSEENLSHVDIIKMYTKALQLSSLVFILYALAIVNVQILIPSISDSLSEYTDVFVLLCVLCCLYVVSTPFGVVLSKYGRTDIGFFINVITACCSLPAAFYFIQFGIFSLVVSVFMTRVFISLPLELYYLNKLIGLKTIVFFRYIFISFAIVIASCLFYLLTKDNTNIVLSLFVSAVIICYSYFKLRKIRAAP